MLWTAMSIYDVAEATGTSVKIIEKVYAHARTTEAMLGRAFRQRRRS